jgi:Secretion system C-terminal sorting domain
MKAIITTLILIFVSTFVNAQFTMKVKVGSTNQTQTQDSLTFTDNGNGQTSTLTVLRGEIDTLKFNPVQDEILVSVSIHDNGGQQYINTDVDQNQAIVSIGSLPAGNYAIYLNYGWFQMQCNLVIEAGYLGINEASKEDVQLNVFPNPVVDYVTVRFNTENNDVPVNVYTIGGQLVYTDAANRYAGANDVTVDFSGFNTGIYLVKVGGSTFKVIKN